MPAPPDAGEAAQALPPGVAQALAQGVAQAQLVVQQTFMQPSGDDDIPPFLCIAGVRVSTGVRS